MRITDAQMHAPAPWADWTGESKALQHRLLIETVAAYLDALGIDRSRTPVVTRDQVRFAKPDPDLFLAAAERLDVAVESASVVGDSVWDMLAARRARSLGIGLLSGGYGEEELERAGAYRVYADPADLLAHLDEVGGRR